MPDSSQKYVKISGRWLSPIWRDRLFIADNHIMHAVRNRFSYTEQYMRFYFKDIQALVFRPTKTVLIVNLCVLAWIALLLLTGWGIGGKAEMVFTAIGIPFAVWLLISLVLGPSCTCHVRTAVQEIRLPALFRRKQALKALERIAEQISLVQGEFTLEHKAAYERLGMSAPTEGDAAHESESPSRQAPDTGAI